MRDHVFEHDDTDEFEQLTAEIGDELESKQEEYLERVAIMIHDGGLSEEEAQEQAYKIVYGDRSEHGHHE